MCTAWSDILAEVLARGETPLTMGVAGHRFLSEAAADWIREEFDRLFRVAASLRCRRAPAAVSALAAGTDQFFASSALAHGLALHVVVPHARYEHEFCRGPEREQYRALLRRADLCAVIPHASASDEAFTWAMQEVVRRSSSLIAGLRPDSPEEGPFTEAAIRHARRLARPCLALDLSRSEIRWLTRPDDAHDGASPKE
ncbi:MAG: hypothetical protein ACOC7J_04370 [Armatimonadota bacterium]